MLENPRFGAEQADELGHRIGSLAHDLARLALRRIVECKNLDRSLADRDRLGR